MHNKILYIIYFLSHQLTAISRYKVHSPFLYKFLNEILRGKENEIANKTYHQLRKKLVSDSSTIELVKFKNNGSSETFFSTITSVGSIAKRSRISTKKAQVLSRLIVLTKPEIVLEFGTSLGMTSSIMAISSPGSKIHTIEGCSGQASIAQSGFDELKLDNIEIEIGNYNQILKGLLSRLEKIDFLFFDGNDNQKTVINIFEKCLPLKVNESVFVFNSIYRSKSMKKAWDYIKTHDETIVSIDFFDMGMVLFRNELSKQQIKYKL